MAAENRHAVWIPCAGYSLNLVGQTATGYCQATVHFPYCLEAIYVLYTISTHRHELLTDSLKTVKSDPVSVPKRISIARLSCRSDAVNAKVSKAFHQSFKRG